MVMGRASRTRAGLAVAGAFLMVGLVAGSADAATVTYGGSFSAATAMAHLQGAAPGDVRVRSTASWSTANAFHYRVVVSRFDLNKVDAAHFGRVSSITLRLSNAGRVKGYVFFTPTPSNGATIWCSSRPAFGMTPISGGASVATGTVNLAVPLSIMDSCGLRRGWTIGVDVVSTLDVNGPKTGQGGGWTYDLRGLRSVV